MKLSPRLQCIADMIHENSYIADIGTDHAYIPIYLVKNGICKRAVATDVRQGPINRAVRNISLYGLTEEIHVRKGYGLSPLNENEVDCVVLGGMGGHLICDILKEDARIANTIESFIIQPVQAPEVVREFLYNNNYKIISERLVKEEEKVYQIIVVEHGIDNIEDEIYYEIGKKLIEYNDPQLPGFIKNKISELNKIIFKIRDKDSEGALNKIQECKRRLEKMEEILRCL